MDESFLNGRIVIMRPVIAKKMFGNFVKDCNKTLINSNKLMLYLFPTPTAPFRSGVKRLEEVQKRWLSGTIM